MSESQPIKSPKSKVNGWGEWSNHVLIELQRLNTCLGELDTKMDTIAINVAMLQVKAGVWGAIGGAIPVAIGLAVYFLTRGTGQ